MLSTSRIHLLAALIGTAAWSCAGGGAHEDNQATRQGEPKVVVSRIRGPEHGESMQAFVAAPRFFAQDGDGPRLRHALPHEAALLMRQSGPRLGANVEASSDGLRVTEVLEISLAKSAGVQVDDVLLRVGDEHIDRVADVRHALQGKRPGDKVVVAVIRAGQGIVELEGTVPEPPADAKVAMDGMDGARGGFLGVMLKEESEPAAADDDAQADGETDAKGADAGAPQTADAQPGVVVAEVVPNSAAWFAGLEADDRVLAIDGQEVASNADLVGAIASKEPGSMIELKYARGGAEQVARVRLGQRSPLQMFGQLEGLQGLHELPGLPDLQGLQGLQDLSNLQFSGPLRFQTFDGDAFSDVPWDDVTDLRVQIEGDELTIERNGAIERYMRDSTGRWVPVDGASADDSADPSKA